MKKEAYSITDFCELYSISIPSLHKEAAAGKIRIRKRGNRKFVSRTDAERWFNGLPIFPPCNQAPEAQPEPQTQADAQKPKTRSSVFIRSLFRTWK